MGLVVVRLWFKMPMTQVSHIQVLAGVLALLFPNQLPANAPEKVLGPPSPTWETQMKFQAPRLDKSQSQLFQSLGSKSVDEKKKICLPFK